MCVVVRLPVDWCVVERLPVDCGVSLRGYRLTVVCRCEATG